MKYLPGLEPLEEKQLLNAGPSTRLVNLQAGSRASTSHPADTAERSWGRRLALREVRETATHWPIHATHPHSQQQSTTNVGYLVYRITNPNRFNNHLSPPFTQVLVQSQQPVPGQVYNVLFVVVRNGTAKTFDASSGFAVKLPQDPNSFPILTGSQQWKPGQQFVFYVLTKKYYPLPSQVHSGFQFDLGGARSVSIPGPSGIFLRVKYDPATFARTLDSIVVLGAGTKVARREIWPA